jgi:hypothetical protein
MEIFKLGLAEFQMASINPRTTAKKPTHLSRDKLVAVFKIKFYENLDCSLGEWGLAFGAN